jgi:branched-chain amino acid transport system substrate-binding protein
MFPKVLAALLCASALMAACASPATVRETGPILIGMYADLSSSSSLDGNDALRGAQLRVADANAGSGVGGRVVQLIPLDSRQSPAEAVKAYSSLAQQEGMSAVIGAAVANGGIAVSPVAELMKVPYISLGIDDRATIPDLPTAGPAAANLPVRQFTFMVRPSAARMSEALASYAAQRLPYRRYATLADPSDPLSLIQARSFEAVIRTAGRTVAAAADIPADGADFTAALDQIGAGGADAVYLCGGAAQDAAAARAIWERGMSVALLGNQAWDATFLSQAGVAGENGIFAVGMSPDDPVLAPLSARMRAAFGDAARPLAAWGWDAVGLVLAAVRRAGSSNALRVRDALEQTTGFRAVAAMVDMDRKSHRLSPLPVAVMTLRAGLFTTLVPRFSPRDAAP